MPTPPPTPQNAKSQIAARRAQYEHYRDRLLSFPEKKAE